LLISTIVATQVGGGTVIGISSSAFSSGTGFGLVALISTVSGFLCVAFLAPWAKRFGDRNQAYTLSEMLRRRYGRSVQLAAAILMLVAYLALLGGQFLSAAVLIQVWSGWQAETTILVSAILMIVYSAFAGLRGDIITDAVHLCAKSVALFLIVLPAIWLREPLINDLLNADAAIWSPLTFGGYSYLIAGIALGAIIPVVSMEMWMRVYAASNEITARRAFIWSAVGVIPFYVLPLCLGIAATQFSFQPSRPDTLLVELIFAYLPHGLLGIAVAGLLAVVVSCANTMVVVLGAILYRDILDRQAGADCRKEIRISRLLTLGVGLAGFGLAVLVGSIVQLILSAFFIIGMIGPVLIGVSIWRRATKTGAFWALISGGIVTIGLLPVMPQQAFLPGLAIGTLLFFGLSLLTSHSESENLTM
jgi:SSS family solute:Na+ symporter